MTRSFQGISLGKLGKSQPQPTICLLLWLILYIQSFSITIWGRNDTQSTIALALNKV
ncbi:MAG: hypothetical protein J5I52_10890 [Saprospiraceae bacterium]|nr:hypothetical protein [Saprospiraceae bacterium]